MKVSFYNPYWANAFGAVGIFFALSLMVRGCCDREIEAEKTKQIEIKYAKDK